MDPTTRPRLSKERQVIVSNAAETALAANRPTPLLLGTVTRAEALVAAGREIQRFNTLTARKVDAATDSAVRGLERVIEGMELILSGNVVKLEPAQEQSLARYRMLRSRAFPQGTGYLRKPMGLQWSDMVTLRTTLLDPEVAAAIDAEGLRVVTNHVLAHVAIYGRYVGQEGVGATGGTEEANDAWTDAMQMYASQVLLDYENDAAMRQELLGPYEAQLEEQRAARAAARAARAKSTQNAPAPAPAPSPAPAPAPEPPPTQADGSKPAAA